MHLAGAGIDFDGTIVGAALNPAVGMLQKGAARQDATAPRPLVIGSIGVVDNDAGLHESYVG